VTERSTEALGEFRYFWSRTETTQTTHPNLPHLICPNGDSPVTSSTGLRFEGTAFWVRHRNQEYGPFDYEWARDLGGIELTYQREKFGEFCDFDAICADLREFKLPMRVVEVSSIVCGSIVFGVLNALSDLEKRDVVRQHLEKNGLERFSENIL
jgi:hypothetical protein